MQGNLENMQSLTGRIKSIAIDTTLTKKGMCAEAKATGEALATKVNKFDIVDDLTSVASDKPLSANQGRVLKKQIDEIDPHYAENVIYDDTNVKDAIDKLKDSKANTENLAMLESAVGFTKKQLIPYPYYNTSRTQNDTDWVDSGDGSISVSGTPSADNMFVIISRNSSPITLKAGTYILSGCPSGGSEETYRLYVTRKIPNGGVDDSEFIAIDYGEGCKFTIEEDSVIGIACQVKSGVILQDVVIKPMLRYASIEDSTYEPYVPDVQTQIDNLISKKTYTIQTTADSGATPFTRVGTIDVTNEVSLYGEVVGAFGASAAGYPLPIVYSGSKKKITLVTNAGTVYATLYFSKKVIDIGS